MAGPDPNSRPEPPTAADRPADFSVVYAAGTLLVASGLFHIGVWAVLGGPWAGPVAWRKPILFGISGGITCLSVGWAFGKPVVASFWDVPLARAFAAAMVAEVGLITLQTWRGVPSHFNEATPFDAAVARAMTGCIVAVSLIVAALAVRCRGPLRLAADGALALRAGLAYLLVACAFGFWISEVGARLAAEGASPEVYGNAGVLKFPHGMPLHAVQMLPALAWLAAAAGWAVPARYRAVAAAVAGQAVLTAYSAFQTFNGRGRGELTPISAALLGLGLLAVGVPFALASAGAVRRFFRAAAEAPAR